eukprot:1160481-Pelagomonas_calceolata.AAC.3
MHAPPRLNGHVVGARLSIFDAVHEEIWGKVPGKPMHASCKVTETPFVALDRANGYFIYATVEGVSFQPADVPVGPSTLCHSLFDCHALFLPGNNWQRAGEQEVPLRAIA